jgi:hypothetical protein
LKFWVASVNLIVLLKLCGLFNFSFFRGEKYEVRSESICGRKRGKSQEPGIKTKKIQILIKLWGYEETGRAVNI